MRYLKSLLKIIIGKKQRKRKNNNKIKVLDYLTQKLFCCLQYFQKNKSYLGVCLFLLILIVVFYHIILAKEKYDFVSICDTWQSIGHPSLRYKMFSAYYDDRWENFRKHGKSKLYYNRKIFAVVRVNAILPNGLNKTDLNCHFRLRNGTIEKFQAYNAIPNQESFNLPFASTSVICALLTSENDIEFQYPTDVGITYDGNNLSRSLTNLVKIRYPKNFTAYYNPKDAIAICAGPLQNHFHNSLRIVEHVEIYKLLGVSRFYFYNDSISKDVAKVLDYYSKTEEVVILDHKIEKAYKSEKELRYDGMFSTITDCVFRTGVIDNFKYVGVADFDEVLMPIKNESLLQLLNRYDNSNTSSFIFCNTFFFKKFGQDDSTVPYTAKNRFLYSQVNIIRTKKVTHYFHRTKYVVKPREVFELGMHRIYNQTNGTKHQNVNITEGLNFHYRDPCVYEYGACYQDQKRDSTARRIGLQLWENVDKVCGEIFENGICPFRTFYGKS